MKRQVVFCILAAVLAIAGIAWFYAPYLLAHLAIAPYGDTVYLTGPLFCEIARNVQAGGVPLLDWSTFEALDYTPHVAPYYPFYFFGWLKFCSADAAVQAADFITVVHVLIFTLTTTSLIRATGANFPSALIGAAICVTLPNTYSLAVFPTFITSAAWLPMAVEGLVRLYYRQQLAIGTILLALGLGAMLTAGPGTNLLSAVVLVGLIMSVDKLIRLLRARNFREGGYLAGVLIGAAALTALLTLPSTLYLYSHLGEFIRWTRSGPVIGAASAANASEILTEQQGWRDLVQLLVPINVTYAAGNFLLGPAAAFLAIYGGVSQWRNPRVMVFFVVSIFCIVIVFLSPAFFVRLWSIIPGLSHTRHLSLVGTPLSISIAILSAHGLEALMTGGRSLRAAFRRCAAIVLLGLHFAFLIGVMARNPGAPPITDSTTWRSVEAALEQIRSSDPDPGRIALHTSIKSGDLTFLNAGSIATYLGMTTFSHYSSPRIYWKFMHEISLVGDNRFAPFGGKYLLSLETLDKSLGEKFFDVGNIQVYLLSGYRPLVTMICLPPQELDRVLRGETRKLSGQLRQLLGPAADAVASAQDGQRDCATAEEKRAPQINRAENALEFPVSAGEARLAVINLPPYAAWRMQISGQKVAIENLQERQIVAVIPAGVSGKARLVYEPRLYPWLKLISGLAWLGAVAALIWLLVWRRAERVSAAAGVHL